MGTMNHPYRTILPALDEILLHFSNSESEVEILLKEGTTTYIEDSKALIINIKHLIIQTYNDTSSPAGYATLCTIDQPQEKISLKAQPLITVDIDSIISGQGFTENELQQIGKSGANFEVIRSSITMNQLIIRRIASSTTSGQFMFLIYLQNRTMSLTNMEFYITGKIVTSNDPLNVNIENLYIDTYQVTSIFDFTISCNYPEAYLTPDLIVTNFTAGTSNLAEVVDTRAAYMYYSGPGNISMTHINATNAFLLASKGGANCHLVVTTFCNPNDDELKMISVDGLYKSTPYNDDNSRTNIFVIEMDTSAIRQTQFNASNIGCNDFNGGIYP